MVCTKWRQRQRHLVALSLLRTAAATMTLRSSLEALRRSISGQIMVKITIVVLKFNIVNKWIVHVNGFTFFLTDLRILNHCADK